MGVTWRTANDAASSYWVEWRDAVGEYPGGRVGASSESAPGGRGYLHKANITQLQPDTEYHYRLSGDDQRLSAERSFRTAPRTMPANGVVFTVNGDVGTSFMYMDVAPVMSQLAREPAGLHVINGDLTYADVHGGTWYEEYWLSNDLAPVAERRPVLVTWGNHDYNEYGPAYDVGIDTITRYFQLPANSNATACNPFPQYALRYAGVFIMALDDPSPHNLCFSATAQQAWARHQLAAAAADPTVHWKVVIVHRPPFSSGCHGSEERSRYPEFDQYQVNLVIGAHDHNYERTWPVNWDGSAIASSYSAPPFATYLVAGVGGSATYNCRAANPWSAFHDEGEYVGYVRVTATENSLTGEFVGKQAYIPTSEFRVVDRFTLSR